MTNPTPEALTRLRQVASAETGAGRMFTLDDAAEIVAYIDRLEALTPSARIMGDKGWENPAEGAHPTSEPLPDAVEKISFVIDLVAQLRNTWPLYPQAGEVTRTQRELINQAATALEALSQREARLVEVLRQWVAYDDLDEADFSYVGPMLAYSRAINATRALLAEGGGG